MFTCTLHLSVWVLVLTTRGRVGLHKVIVSSVGEVYADDFMESVKS
jgi:hypothetical protein